MEDTLPQHIKDGKKMGFTMGPNGEIIIGLDIHNETNGKALRGSFMIDTGFNGFIQLTPEIVKKLGLEITYNPELKTKMADGSIKEIGITKSKVKMLNLEMSGFGIQVLERGALLIGTSFLKESGFMLLVDFQRREAKLTTDKRIKDETISFFNKLAQ